MQRVLAETSDPAGVIAALVWVHILDGDDASAAQAAAARLQHPRLAHFHDPRQLAARQIAAALGGAGDVAWDVYLAFAADAAWEDGPPRPADWVHQLDHASWAPVERRRKGEALVEALRSMLTCAQIV